MHAHHNRSLSILPFSIIGIIAGAIFTTILLWPNESPLLVLWSSSFTVILLLAYPQAPSITRLVAGSVIASFLIAIPIRYGHFAINTPILLLINTLAINAFHLSYQQHRTLFNYPALFNGVWESIIKIAITCVFALVCHLLLVLWGQLFIAINLPFFQRLFSATWLLAWSSVFFVSIGLYIASKNQLIINKLLNLILTACRLLVPTIAIAILVFIAFAIVIQFTPKHQFRVALTLFMAVGLTGIILINGLLQSSLTLTPYKKAVQWAVNAFVILLPLFPLTVLYAVIFIHKVPNHLHGIVYHQLLIENVLLAIYTLSYSASFIFCHRPWLFTLKITNMVMGIVLILLCLSLNNPYTKHQYVRSTTQHSQQVKRNEKYDLAQELQTTHEALQHAHFGWGDPQRQDATIIGYNPSPIVICRSTVNAQSLYGVGDHQSCSLLVNQTIQTTQHFQVLYGPKNAIQWSNLWTVNQIDSVNDHRPVPVIVNQIASERKGKSGWAGICRAIYQNKIYAGYINLHTKTCTIIVNKQIVSIKSENASSFQVLQLQAKKAHAQPPEVPTHVDH